MCFFFFEFLYSKLYIRKNMVYWIHLWIKENMFFCAIFFFVCFNTWFDFDCIWFILKALRIYSFKIQIYAWCQYMKNIICYKRKLLLIFKLQLFIWGPGGFVHKFVITDLKIQKKKGREYILLKKRDKYLFWYLV